ncbi:MAG: matrixin family metalloprotease [Gemmatimonadota bacterium]|nr:matrixin family metalloprotease [Gemmatimonadota bacterium]
MKRIDLLPLALLVPVIAFVAVQAAQTPRITVATGGAVAARGTISQEVETPDSVATEAPADLGGPNPDAADVRRRLQQGEHGTYIGEILRQRDSALARWPERVGQPVRVWIAPGNGMKDWDPAFGLRVHDAFDEWSGLGIPVRFIFVVDSSDADVHVVWIDHFKEPISGKTLWARDRRWWIVDGNITLALHHNGGEALDTRAVQAIALHEVGHLLGLDHTSDTTNIMTPRVRVRDLSEADRATMRLLYTLPAGSVK